MGVFILKKVFLYNICDIINLKILMVEEN